MEKKRTRIDLALRKLLNLKVRRGLLDFRDFLRVTRDEVLLLTEQPVPIILSNKKKREWYCIEECGVGVGPAFYKCDKCGWANTIWPSLDVDRPSTCPHCGGDLREVEPETMGFSCGPVVDVDVLAYLIDNFWGYRVYFLNPRSLKMPLYVLQYEKLLKRLKKLFLRKRTFCGHNVANDYQFHKLLEYGIPVRRIVLFILSHKFFITAKGKKVLEDGKEYSPDITSEFHSVRGTLYKPKVYQPIIEFVRSSPRRSFTSIEAAWFLHQIAKEGKEKMEEFFSRIIDGWEIFREENMLGVKWPEAPAGFENWKIPASFLAEGLPITKYEGKGKEIIPLNDLADEGARLIETFSHIETLSECEYVVHLFMAKTWEMLRLEIPP